MKIDTASLVVHRDTDSFITQISDNLSKLSAVFTFDRELFVSKVYERALRGSVKESLKIQQGHLDFVKESLKIQQGHLDFVKESLKRSKAIDRELESDRLRLKTEYKVLLLGSSSSGKERMVKEMKILHQNGYTTEELISYRLAVYKNVIDSIKSLIEAMRQFEIELEDEADRKLRDLLMGYTVDTDKPLGKMIGDAISSIWNDPCVSKVRENPSAFYMMDEAP